MSHDPDDLDLVLAKRASDEVEVILTKGGQVKRRMKVCKVWLFFDTSGSTRSHWPDTMRRILAFISGAAFVLDDDGSLQVATFSQHFHQLVAVTKANLNTYINTYIMGTDALEFSWTNFAPSFQHMLVEEKFIAKIKPSGRTPRKTGLFAKLNSLFSSEDEIATDSASIVVDKPTGDNPDDLEVPNAPVFAIVFTDGKMDDWHDVLALFERHKKSNVFVQIVGYDGASSLSTLKSAARTYENVDTVSIDDIAAVANNPEEVMRLLVTEKLLKWNERMNPTNC